MVDPISLLIAGGIVGYALKPDGKIVPVTYNNLRESKPQFYKKVNIDISVAREDVEFPLEGTLIYIENPTTPTKSVYIKLDEPDRDDWELTTLRKLRIPFYRFFITNEAGTGTLIIYIGRGLQVEPFEGVVDTVGSVLNAIGDVAAGAPNDDDVLGYVASTGYWTSVPITDIAGFATHKTRHQDGGDDELSLTGLAGEPATLATHKALTTGVHGVGAGAIVGTTLTQTLTNKRLTSPKINENVILTATATELNVLDGIPSTLTATELGYADGVTSAIQAQLNAKVAKALFDANTILYATSDDTPEAKTRAELIALLSGQAGGAFSWNGQNLTNVGAIAGTSLALSATLGVAGITQLQQTLVHSTLSVAGQTTLAKTIIGSTLGVAGLASFVSIFLTNDITVGGDITITGTVDGVNVSDHKTRHQDGGDDEISIAGLAGSPAQKAAASGLASLNASSLVVQKPADRLGVANLEWTANKLAKGAGTGASPTLIDVPVSVGLEATVALFQANAATGTFSTNPDDINDNNTSSLAKANGIGQYAEVDFGKVVNIRRWRQFGHTDNQGDGRWKIEYYDLENHAWTDWKTGIATRTSLDWSTLSTETGKLTDKIRLTVTTVDGDGENNIEELEVIY